MRKDVREKMDKIYSFISSDFTLSDASLNFFKETCDAAAREEINRLSMEIIAESREVNEIIRSQAQIKVKGKLITISLPPTINFKDTYNILKAYIESGKKYIKSAIYCMEFHGSNLLPTHPHFHILLPECEANKKRLIRDFSNKFDISCNYVDVENLVNVDKAASYIRGNKSEQKNDQVQLDRTFRLDLGIPDFEEYDPKNQK